MAKPKWLVALDPAAPNGDRGVKVYYSRVQDEIIVHRVVVVKKNGKLK